MRYILKYNVEEVSVHRETRREEKGEGGYGK